MLLISLRNTSSPSYSLAPSSLTSIHGEFAVCSFAQPTSDWLTLPMTRVSQLSIASSRSCAAPSPVSLATKLLTSHSPREIENANAYPTAAPRDTRDFRKRRLANSSTQVGCIHASCAMCSTLCRRLGASRLLPVGAMDSGLFPALRCPGNWRCHLAVVYLTAPPSLVVLSFTPICLLQQQQEYARL